MSGGQTIDHGDLSRTKVRYGGRREQHLPSVKTSVSLRSLGGPISPKNQSILRKQAFINMGGPQVHGNSNPINQRYRMISQTVGNKPPAFENRVYSRQQFKCRNRLDDVAAGTRAQGFFRNAS